MTVQVQQAISVALHPELFVTVNRGVLRHHGCVVCRRHHHHIRPRRFPRTNAHRRILEHQAVLHGNTQALGPQHITRGIRLAEGHIFCRYQRSRRRNACGLQATQRQCPRSGGHQGPLITRQAVQKLDSTGNRHDPLDIVDLGLGNPLRLDFRINTGQ